MRILAAFDKYKDSFSAQEACGCVEDIAANISHDLEVVSCPLTDGGEGFVDILTTKAGGELLTVNARNSHGSFKEAKIGIVSIDSLNREVRSYLQLPQTGKLAILEMASVCGLSDLKEEERDPRNTSTLGVGDLLMHAKKEQADVILLGIGGSSTNDAGIGALCAMGIELKNSSGESILFPSPNNWEKISSIESKGLENLPPLLIACDVDNPLLGEMGATYQFGPQKGLFVDNIPALEESIVSMITRLEPHFPNAKELSHRPGCGAAGGLGYGLSLAGNTKLVSGFELVSNWLELEKEVLKSDLILTGEGRFDGTSWRGKGPFELLKLSKYSGKPAVLLSASIDEKIKDRSIEEFPDFEFISFAKKSWSLDKNLKYGLRIFKDSCRMIIDDRIQGTKFECPTRKKARFKRIRRLKKFLRPLPRRSNVHRYPVLKWFADTAYKKSFLWSFKGQPIQAALFWGIWISMLPIVGIQMIVVFFISLLVRANLPLIVALQWISNPLTMGPIYFADYKIGMILLNLTGFNYPQNKILSAKYDWSEFSLKEIVRLLDTFPPMFIGGSVLGIFFGISTVFLYKIFTRFYKN